MAEKKSARLGVFRKTEGQPSAENADLDEGGIRSTGVGLTRGEIAALDKIGAELGDFIQSDPVARHALVRIAVRRFIEAFRSGEITPGELSGLFEVPERPKPKLRL